ncbi:DUF6292 family protein [Sciscionella sediminilitoris]|uniref:DUF6292 family protein n=1 Tax=Sciscionella sediminilitoris TaxID=1445613 RepID=UPI00068F1DD2|nr:DUF6292 family protein [Sciscionella sp. SE31]
MYNESDIDWLDWALRTYVHRVAAGFGLGPGATCCEVAELANAYIALATPAPHRPDREAALVWDQRYGWAFGIETYSGEDLLILAYHTEKLLPEPDAVVTFVKSVRAEPENYPTPADPPRFDTTTEELTSQLLTYLPVVG